MSSNTTSPVYCDPDPERARHESERVTFLVGERVRVKARIILYVDTKHQFLGVLDNMYVHVLV